MIVASALRCYPGEQVCGDGWLAEHDGGHRWLIAVIDGTGHGSLAAEANEAARAAIHQSAHLPVVDALGACHAALRGTRGAAVSIARIDLEAGQLLYAGVGNVEARLRTPERDQRLIAYRGIVGAIMPRVKSFEYPLGADWLLLLNTDGVSTRFNLDEVLSTPCTNLQAVADVVLDRWGRSRDDACVVVAGPDASP